ncbi:DMT family transporter [Paenibacillus sp. HB172176]|uniref:DMT family transporter n=1 Tax=Paenibacillus sp. HB172176 TaxID=2493690 RepID=UPI001438DA8F|nr:DMT family transporter [Paenibacillus sp. HB172176]
MGKGSTAGIVYAAAVCYMLIIGFAFLFIKLSLESADPIDALAHRFTVAFAAISILFLILRRRISLIGGKQLLSLLPLVLFYPFLFFLLQTYGLEYTTSGEAGIVNATVPIFTMLLASFFLRERASLLQKLFTLLTVSGVVFIFLMKGANFQASGIRGIVLIMLSALALSAYSILTRKLTLRHHFLDLTFVILLAGFIVFNALSVAHHAAEGTLPSYFDSLGTPSFLWSILYLGIPSTAGTALLTSFILTRMEALRMSLFNNAATVITILAGVFFLDESLAYYHIIGACMVLVGVVGVNLAGRMRRGEAVLAEKVGKGLTLR